MTVNDKPVKMDPSEVSAEELAKHLGVEMDQGLSSGKAKEILDRDGPNELDKPPRPTLLILFLVQLTGFIIVLLIVAAIASAAVNATSEDPEIVDFTTAVAILVIVILNAGIAAYTEHQAGDALEALAKMSQATIDVLRDGNVINIKTPTVVVGDIVILMTGNVVPADLRLFKAEDVKVSEMLLTGEPDDVAKTFKLKPKKEGEEQKLTPENMVFSGCNVTNGAGRGIVTATGMGTRIGEIAKLIEGDEKPKTKCFGMLPDSSASQTPLQANVETLGAKIGVLAIVVCIIVFAIGLFAGVKDPDNPEGETWLYMILVAVTLAVAAIPEGIPLCVTISLSIGCSHMVKKNVLVRKLAAVETLGSASIICSDKTGTLTEGKMTMVAMWSGGVNYEVTGKGFDPTVGTVLRKGGVDAKKDLGVVSSLLSAMLCCNTTISKNEEEKWEPKGNSSEAPIIVAGMKLGFNTTQLEKDYPRVEEVPFSSSRKMMLTVSSVAKRSHLCDGGMRLPDGTNFLAVCKGAPNYIIDECVSYMTEDGRFEPLTEEKKKETLGIVDDYSSQAWRVLAIATNLMAQLPYDKNDDDIGIDLKFSKCRQNLQLIGLVASIDPERDGVPDSVDLARGAGIRVVMITGDYLKTAVAIGKNVRILQDGDDEDISAVDCKKLRPGEDGAYLPSDEFDLLTAHVKVFARAKPEDKLEIVTSLQRQGFVSAMTGDGVNDAPALNKADIGVAMGIQGTEVAKGASDMILVDDNFCSIVTAVEKGRAIYAGIQKFVAFIMSVHIAEVMQIAICIVWGVPLMRNPVQILFLILVTDLPPSIALGMEPGEDNILKNPPRPKTEPIVLMWMWQSIVANGAILSVVIIAVYIWSLTRFLDGYYLMDDISEVFKDGDGNPTYEDRLMKARTVAFISLVFSENVRAYISRSFDQFFLYGVFKNVHMQKAIFLAQLCLAAAVFIPGFNNVVLSLDGVAVGGEGWLMALVGPIGCIVLCELYKIITHFQIIAYQKKIAAEHEKNVAKRQEELRRSTAKEAKKAEEELTFTI